MSNNMSDNNNKFEIEKYIKDNLEKEELKINFN